MRTESVLLRVFSECRHKSDMPSFQAAVTFRVIRTRLDMLNAKYMPHNCFISLLVNTEP